jgi:hypothetical protein
MSCPSGAGDTTALDGAAVDPAAEELDGPAVGAFSAGTVHANSTTLTSHRPMRIALISAQAGLFGI